MLVVLCNFIRDLLQKRDPKAECLLLFPVFRDRSCLLKESYPDLQRETVTFVLTRHTHAIDSPLTFGTIVLYDSSFGVDMMEQDHAHAEQQEEKSAVEASSNGAFRCLPFWRSIKP
jgi:hypothetical protein